MIAGYLNIKNPLTLTASDKFSSYIVTYACFIGCCLFIPIILIRAILCTSIQEMNSIQFEEKYGGVFQEYNKKSKFSIGFSFIFLVRRFILYLIIFQHSLFILAIQCNIMMYISLFVSMYVTHFRPYNTR